MEKIQKCDHINGATKTNKRHRIFINVKKDSKEKVEIRQCQKLNMHVMTNLNDCNSEL